MRTKLRLTRSVCTAAASLVIVAALSAPAVALAEDQTATHHILYDPTDHVYRCLGSAVDCDWSG